MSNRISVGVGYYLCLFTFSFVQAYGKISNFIVNRVIVIKLEKQG